MRFKIDWASLIVGSKLTIFALFYFVFEGNCPSTSPRWAYIWRGDLTEDFLHYQFGGLIFGGAYFRNFTVFLVKERTVLMLLCGSHVYVGNQTSLEQQPKHQAPKQSSTGKKNSFLISKIIKKRYTHTCSTSMQSSVST